MIARVIHYCWFGGKPLGEKEKKCIDSWKKYCPNYKIIEWNERNFDVNCNKYVKEAYENKKWAFVSDYARLYALVNNGGVYMDTDVELIKPIDSFLKNKAFSGFEDNSYVPTGIMACEKNFKLFKEFLDDYNNRSFIREDGSFDLTTNVETMTKICEKHGLVKNNQFQCIDGFALYPNDYFCPKSHFDERIYLTDNTVTIHHFAASWYSNADKKKKKLSVFLCKNFGIKVGMILFKTVFIPYRLVLDLKENGVKKTIEKVKRIW